MVILHIAPNAPFDDGWSYQENLLPKYQMRLGNDVVLIVTDQQNSPRKDNRQDFISKDGFRVIRCKSHKLPIPKGGSLLSYINVYDILCDLKPDFIFYHGMVSATIFQVVKYVKVLNKKCIVVQDNHLDENIGVPLSGVKNRVISLIYSSVFKATGKYISKVYGVTPWRREYVEKFYHVPRSKTDILIMGADDEKIDLKNRITIRNDLRKKYHISSSDFLILTGGKIDKDKKIIPLMKAVNQTEGTKLLVFGSVADQLKQEFFKNLSEKVSYVGWIDAKEYYNYCFASDLVCFPGQHSVLWEQACASKVPCLFGYWPGMTHVDNGGNSDFLFESSVDEIKNKIVKLKFTEKYYNMKKAAESDKTDIYLYSKIAEKSLECISNANN